jgi:hypothetical protein
MVVVMPLTREGGAEVTWALPSSTGAGGLVEKEVGNRSSGSPPSPLPPSMEALKRSGEQRQPLARNSSTAATDVKPEEDTIILLFRALRRVEGFNSSFNLIGSFLEAGNTTNIPSPVKHSSGGWLLGG